jgi:nicotinamidase-related amidase
MAEVIDPRRTALVYFDCLKTYAYDRDLKGLVPEARHQVEALVRLNKLARAADIPVFYARADHRPDGRDGATAITDLDLLRPAGGGGGEFGRVWGTEASNIIDEIAPEPGDYQIYKHRWNMFFQTELALSLRTRDIDTILLAGGSTEVGVASSAYNARDMDFNTIIVREAQRSGRGRWVTDFYVDNVAGGHARVRSLAEVAAMLAAGGANVTADTSPLPEQVGSAGQPAIGAALARDPSLDPAHSAVLLFDFLNGGNYDRQTRRLSDASRPMVEAAQRMVAEARSLGMPIFYTQAIHRPDGADWASTLNDRDGSGGRRVEVFGRDRTRPGSTAGSWEAEIIDELAPQPGDYIMRKHRWSAFEGTPLELSLRRAGVTNVLLAGSTMDVGIASTAYAGRDRDFNLVLLRDAQRARTPEVESYFMDHVFPRLGRVRSVDRAIDLLHGKGTE